jgi:hypothetical protein
MNIGWGNLFPGGSGAPLDRQKDRSAGSPLDWTSPRQAKHLPQPRSRKRGSGAESAGYDRFGECRGERRKASGPRASACGDMCRCGRGPIEIAPFGASLPSAFLGGRNESNKARARRAARTIFFYPPPRSETGRGRGTREAWWRGRAVLEQAPRPTPLPPRKRAVPPPRYCGAG